MRVSVCYVPGEYDYQLTWPTKAEFTVELINHFKGGENKRAVETISWSKPTGVGLLLTFTSDPWQCLGCFIKHSELPANHQQETQFLIDDTLHFISNVRVLN